MSLHLIIGPMFSGKTTTLIRLKNRATIAGKKCLIIKYYLDQRYQAEQKQISTHDLLTSDAITSTESSLHKTIKSIDQHESYDAFFIDEIQFYDDADVVCDQLANQGYEVIVCGLSGDFNRKPFGRIPQLVALADKITHLTAIDAHNGQEAPFTYRISAETNQTVIGGEEKYVALSRSSYVKSQKFKSPEFEK